MTSHLSRPNATTTHLTAALEEGGNKCELTLEFFSPGKSTSPGTVSAVSEALNCAQEAIRHLMHLIIPTSI
jgi:hypothetical protein